MPAEGTPQERNDLPEGAVITTEIEVVGWLDPSGEVRYGTRYAGDAQVSTIVGLLEMAKHDVLVGRDEEE